MPKMLICTKPGNPHLQGLVDAVTAAGVTPITIDPCKPEELFAYETTALFQSDAVILLRPEEEHHHALLAYASGRGKATFLCTNGLQLKESWMSFADHHCASIKELVAVLEAVLQ